MTILIRVQYSIASFGEEISNKLDGEEGDAII